MLRVDLAVDIVHIQYTLSSQCLGKPCQIHFVKCRLSNAGCSGRPTEASVTQRLTTACRAREIGGSEICFARIALTIFTHFALH